jgi:cytochrome c peroxidase
MHDGSITTLEAVIDHYAAGGRARNIGPDSLTDNLVAGFELTSEERKQLVEFLRALTDESFVSRAREESIR